MKGHIKAIIIVFIILITYTIFVYAYANSKNKKVNKEKEPEKPVPIEPEQKPVENPVDNDYDLNIVLYNKIILGYKNKTWYENPNYDYVGKDFDFYTNGEKYSPMSLVYTDRWYVMDNEKNFMDYDNGFLAVNSKIDYTIYPYRNEQVDNNYRSDIESFLQAKEISYNYDTLKKNEMRFDLNRDGILDNIYVLSNLFLTDYTGYDKTFSYVFLKTLNQYVTLYENSYNAVDAVSLCEPYIEGIVSVDATNTLIIGCEYFSQGGTKYMLYNVNGKNVEKLLETKAN